jgi:hypothetical protein
MYFILSILAYFFAPEFLQGMASLLNRTFHTDLNGLWFWLIGAILLGFSSN